MVFLSVVLLFPFTQMYNLECYEKMKREPDRAEVMERKQYLYPKRIFRQAGGGDSWGADEPCLLEEKLAIIQPFLTSHKHFI